MQAPLAAPAASAAPVDTCHPQLLPLKSVLEVDLRVDLVDAALIEIPASAANDVVNILVAAKPEKGAQVPLTHLRRFVKPQDVPTSLVPQLQERPWSRSGSSAGTSSSASRASSRPQSSHSSSGRSFFSRGNLSRTTSNLSTSDLSKASPSTELSRASSSNEIRSGSSRGAKKRHRRKVKVDKILYLCTNHDVLSCEKILEALIARSIINETPPLPTWMPIKVPLRPPRNDDEASKWSEAYWPCFYRPSNDYGPWATLVEKASAEISARVAECITLARQAGKAAQSSSQGINAGCVIVENGRVICVRGDGRFLGLQPDETQPGIRQENILGHAAMRAIGQVGKLRTGTSTSLVESVSEPREVLGDLTNSLQSVSLKESASSWNGFLEDPIGKLERQYDQESSVESGGYLCLDMEVYLSHEPCLMCCMAMVHSRIKRVIFAKRMPRTGGLTANEAKGSGADDGTDKGAVGQSSLGYGLWYRKELNWRQLAWEWKDLLSHRSYEDGIDCDTHV